LFRETFVALNSLVEQYCGAVKMRMMQKMERRREHYYLWNLSILFLLLLPTEAFVSQEFGSTRFVPRHKQPLCSFWRNWIPQTDFLNLLEVSDSQQERQTPPSHLAVLEDTRGITPPLSVSPTLQTLLTAVILSLLVAIPQAGIAVSGGGLDFAGTDISGKDFSSSIYKGKDFTQVIAKGTNFAKSNLQGCRFYKAYLVRTKNVQNV
jgi:hypothetical protein